VPRTVTSKRSASPRKVPKEKEKPGKTKGKLATITEKREVNDPAKKPLDKASRDKVTEGKARKEVKKAISRAVGKLGPRRKDRLAGGEKAPRKRTSAAVRASDPGVAKAIPRETVRSGAPL
jgi:hypothetical protein